MFQMLKDILNDVMMCMGLLIWLQVSPELDAPWEFITSVAGILMFLVGLDNNIARGSKVRRRDKN